jgi:mannitol-1-/sugar-/sorbitol-6-phosphatase
LPAQHPNTEPEGEIVTTFECRAVLFDLDGVLVDSDAAVVRTWRKWADSRGADTARVLEVAHGRRTADTIRLVAPNLDADLEAAELEQIEAADMDGVLEVEGAHNLLSSLPADAWTVVTSGTRLLATLRMEHVGLPIPERCVTADDVEKGKPHPEAYLKGAGILGVRPEACVVVEDAPSGVRAARAAGMRVVAVTTTYPPADLQEADAVAETLAKIEVVRKPRLALRVMH